MIFTCLLYIVALGSTYWYYFEATIFFFVYSVSGNIIIMIYSFILYLKIINDDDIGFRSKIEVNEGLFQSKIKETISCVDASACDGFTASKTHTSSLDQWKDICKSKPSSSYTDAEKKWCRSQNAVISMLVLAIVCSFVAGITTCFPPAKPFSLCAITFSWIFGMIAMAVYAANKFGYFSDDPRNYVLVGSKPFHSRGDTNQGGDFHGQKISNGHFHFSFSWCVIAWTLNFLAFFLIAASKNEELGKVVAPVTNMVQIDQNK